MTSSENSVSEPPNLKMFWGRIPAHPPYMARAFGTRESAPPSPVQRPSYGPVEANLVIKLNKRKQSGCFLTCAEA